MIGVATINTILTRCPRRSAKIPVDAPRSLDVLQTLTAGDAEDVETIYKIRALRLLIRSLSPFVRSSSLFGQVALHGLFFCVHPLPSSGRPYIFVASN
ncbi:hypothetical protein LshimejAT787_1601180 [Lyophyllum shimeji]|uniref:Uncharacterized protein n=1 Tax=Lyophyllum shimeji TaxID=47721 RepID=A0A9P3PY67_LYOSH|nr:hypothetical protein LshimejAT787_1601180 [Lyophyllum shimeji]